MATEPTLADILTAVQALAERHDRHESKTDDLRAAVNDQGRVNTLVGDSIRRVKDDVRQVVDLCKTLHNKVDANTHNLATLTSDLGTLMDSIADARRDLAAHTHE